MKKNKTGEETTLAQKVFEMQKKREEYIEWANKKAEKDLEEKLSSGVFYPFKITDFLSERFYFTEDNISLSLPYPSLADFNYMMNIAPVGDIEELSEEVFLMWALHCLWILSISKVVWWKKLFGIKPDNDGLKSFKVSLIKDISEHLSFLPDTLLEIVQVKIMTNEIKRKLLPRKKRKKIKLLFIGFGKMMEEIQKMLSTERYTVVEYQYAYDLLTSNESIYSMAKDYNMLPKDFLHKINVVEFACMLSSSDRVNETERKVNEAYMENNTTNNTEKEWKPEDALR